MTTLRDKIIRLAYTKPELRGHLLPILASDQKVAGPAPDNLRAVLALLENIPGVEDAWVIDRWGGNGFAVALRLKVLDSQSVSSTQSSIQSTAPVKFAIGAAQLKGAVTKLLRDYVSTPTVQYPKKVRNTGYDARFSKGSTPASFFDGDEARVEFYL